MSELAYRVALTVYKNDFLTQNAATGVTCLQKVQKFKSVQRSGESMTYLAQGLIFSARPLLIQKPAPPVANQNLTDT